MAEDTRRPPITADTVVNNTSEATGPRCYRDYVIADGRFVGRFEEMYRDVPDPWGCTQHVDTLANRILLELLREVAPSSVVLDVGCGLGALTARVWETIKPTEMHACDVSATAVRAASRAVPAVEFFEHDLVAAPTLPLAPGSVDVIVMAEVVWYILPVLSAVLQGFAALLAPRGALVLKQAFYPPGQQRYGNHIVAAPEDLVRHVEAIGFSIREQIAIDTTDGSLPWLCRCVKVDAP